MSTPTRKSDNLDAPATGLGPIRDIQHVREGTVASIAELKEFLEQLKGRRPQEVIGIVSSSLLFQSIAIATVLIMGILLLFTVVPYLVYGPPEPKKVTPKKSVATIEPEANAVQTPSAPTSGEAATTEFGSSVPDAARASKIMGLDEAKPADPSKNPLDSPDLDKLLDGL